MLYFQGSRSPNEKEREVTGCSRAWMHHKGRNRHHFEYWTDYNTVTKKLEPVKMPDVFIFEMFCDRVAASKIYQGENYTDRSAYDYFLKGRSKTMLHPYSAAKLELLLKKLAEEGEDVAFAYAKQYVKAYRRYKLRKLLSS